MNPSRVFLAASLLIVVPCISAQDTEDDLIRVPELVRECESCHGPRGVSNQDDIPTLAGQPADDILDSLAQFYFYERHCPTTKYRHGDHENPPDLNMCNISSALSQAEKMALAEHFAAQTVPEPSQE